MSPPSHLDHAVTLGHFEGVKLANAGFEEPAPEVSRIPSAVMLSTGPVGQLRSAGVEHNFRNVLDENDAPAHTVSLPQGCPSRLKRRRSGLTNGSQAGLAA